MFCVHVRGHERRQGPASSTFLPGKKTAEIYPVALTSYLATRITSAETMQSVPDRPAVGIEPRLCDPMPRALRIFPVPAQWNSVSIKSIFGPLTTPSARKLPVTRRNTAHSPALRERMLHSREDESPRQWFIDSISLCFGKSKAEANRCEEHGVAGQCFETRLLHSRRACSDHATSIEAQDTTIQSTPLRHRQTPAPRLWLPQPDTVPRPHLQEPNCPWPIPTITSACVTTPHPKIGP